MERATDRTESLVARVVRLTQNVAALLRTRVELTQQEVRLAGRDLIISLIAVLIALLLVLLAVPVAIAMLILALAQVLPPWLATGAVLLAMLAVVGGLLLVARAHLRRPRLTLLTGLKEDWRTIREHLERGP